MPSLNADSETAALYKQMLLRPLEVDGGDEPEDVRLVRAFAPLCRAHPKSSHSRSEAGATAFTRNWLAFEEGQRRLAIEARLRHMRRYEWPSLWGAAEMQDQIFRMWAEESTGFGMEGSPEMDPEHCPDRDKPRATVQQYVALVGETVSANLEGIARARLEKRPKQYQSDAAIHHAFMRSTAGGGEAPCDGDPEEKEAMEGSVKPASGYFEPLPWDLSSADELLAVL